MRWAGVAAPAPSLDDDERPGKDGPAHEERSQFQDGEKRPTGLRSGFHRYGIHGRRGLGSTARNDFRSGVVQPETRR